MNKQSGFTLIELVIVIIILGVLSAVAVPKFVSLRNEAKLATIKDLKATLETASTFTYTRSMIEGLGNLADETLSSGVKIRYGYPYATQTNLKELIDINEDDWEMTSSSSPRTVVFAFYSDAEDMSVAEIISSTELCKLVYTGADKGERPDISISGCDD
ncbi:prepilin-type N-terminal cleavage/methylation domain-containing protein [Psychromonas sp. KJ10-10]|uniref:prepilin-type N-terminal cleavage/methylation domain-containing protein n=1 Tax=Psychromonas sp. KJ10-10 TaxID=3391823 RepID=UPI0039B5D1A0